MMQEQLFEWETTAKPKRGRKTNKEQVRVPRPPGYHLISNTSGIQGFHRSKIPEAAMAKHGSCVTLCGITGRRVSEYPEMVPLCKTCEIEHRKGKG